MTPEKAISWQSLVAEMNLFLGPKMVQFLEPEMTGIWLFWTASVSGAQRPKLYYEFKTHQKVGPCLQFH
jgi:hypothetical protein